MSWVAEEDFESYADESDLKTQSGGSGWSAAWTGGANTVYADTATASEGSVSSRTVSNSGNTFYWRTLTTTISTTGIIYYSMRKSSTGSGVNSVALRSSGGGRFQVRLDNSGNIQAYNQNTTAWVTLTSFSANTWYDIRVTFDVSASSFSVSYWTGSAWATESATFGMQGSGNIDRISVGGDTGSNSWVDKITATDPHAGGGSPADNALSMCNF